MKYSKDLVERLLEHKSVTLYCHGCYYTTRQTYVELPEEEKKFDALTYECGKCHSVRYYDVDAGE